MHFIEYTISRGSWGTPQVCVCVGGGGGGGEGAKRFESISHFPEYSGK